MAFHENIFCVNKRYNWLKGDSKIWSTCPSTDVFNIIFCCQCYVCILRFIRENKVTFVFLAADRTLDGLEPVQVLLWYSTFHVYSGCIVDVYDPSTSIFPHHCKMVLKNFHFNFYWQICTLWEWRLGRNWWRGWKEIGGKRRWW